MINQATNDSANICLSELEFIHDTVNELNEEELGKLAFMFSHILNMKGNDQAANECMKTAAHYNHPRALSITNQYPKEQDTKLLEKNFSRHRFYQSPIISSVIDSDKMEKQKSTLNCLN